MSGRIVAGLGALAVAASLSLTNPARAACDLHNTVPLKSLSAGFQAWKSLTAEMATCGDVTAELDQDFADKLPQALAAQPALYQIAGVANDSAPAVLDAGTIRPLDDLVAKYGGSLSPNQLIKLNGKVYVIGMDVNDQSLLYRADILRQLGVATPTTWDEVLSAAAKIQQAGLMAHPLGATMKSGWNLAEEFVNMYLGFGGSLFADDNQPAIHSPAGVKALDMLKRLTAYMDPEYLTADSTVVQQQMQQGRIALSNLWASRAGAMDDPKESTVVGKVASAKAPAAFPGGKPATTLWWDGTAIATHTTPEQAAAAFQVIVAAMNPHMVAAHNDDVIWLLPGYKPGRLAQGAIASLQAGAPAYPTSARMGLLHSAIGSSIGGFFTGKLSADQALDAAEAAYRTAAREGGLLH
jgi:ABC-type glycerol-3-phosphate transport system substrate-binding protein